LGRNSHFGQLKLTSGSRPGSKTANDGQPIWHYQNRNGPPMGMKPKEVVQAWVEAFNRKDVEAL
jgi:hypothetical protein